MPLIFACGVLQITMDELTHELVLEIANQVSQNDLANLRLACKAFHAAVGEVGIRLSTKKGIKSRWLLKVFNQSSSAIFHHAFQRGC